jgi:hypothetical protein
MLLACKPVWVAMLLIGLRHIYSVLVQDVETLFDSRKVCDCIYSVLFLGIPDLLSLTSQIVQFARRCRSQVLLTIDVIR